MSWTLKGGAPVQAYYEPEEIRQLPPAARRARRHIRNKVADARNEEIGRQVADGMITLEQLRSLLGMH